LLLLSFFYGYGSNFNGWWVFGIGHLVMEEWFTSDANSLFHFMRVALMVSVCTAMYSNNFESCVYVFGVCGWSVVSQAWEDSGGGIKKSKTQKRKSKGCVPLLPNEHPMQAFLPVQNQKISGPLSDQSVQ
jgi:hypothetical protein